MVTLHLAVVGGRTISVFRDDADDDVVAAAAVLQLRARLCSTPDSIYKLTQMKISLTE